VNIPRDCEITGKCWCDAADALNAADPLRAPEPVKDDGVRTLSGFDKLPPHLVEAGLRYHSVHEARHCAAAEVVFPVSVISSTIMTTANRHSFTYWVGPEDRDGMLADVNLSLRWAVISLAAGDLPGTATDRLQASAVLIRHCRRCQQSGLLRAVVDVAADLVGRADSSIDALAAYLIASAKVGEPWVLGPDVRAWLGDLSGVRAAIEPQISEIVAALA
jgi:hypothetical protein